MMSVYILLHGAWHGAWCWEKVIPLLQQAGHTVIAPDLPGHGQDTTVRSLITQATYVQSVGAILVDLPEKVIVVGHSGAGCLISQLGEYYADNIKKLVYLSAFIPRPQESVCSLLSEQKPTAFSQKMVMNIQENAIYFPFGLWRRFGCQRLDKAHGEAIASRLCVEPLAPWQTPLQIISGGYEKLPKMVITCRFDRVLPLVTQKAFAQKIMAPIYSLDSDHSPFYSDPHALAALLNLA